MISGVGYPYSGRHDLGQNRTQLITVKAVPTMGAPELTKFILGLDEKPHSKPGGNTLETPGFRV